MDLLDDDILAEGGSNTAKVGVKFQPKAKPRPVKKGPAVAVSLPSKPSIDSSDKWGPQVCSSNQDALPSKPAVDSSDKWGPQICSSNQDASRVITDILENLESCLEKSEEENADVYIGLDTLVDVIPHSSSIEEGQEQVSIPVYDSAPNIQTDDSAVAQDSLTCQETTYPCLESDTLGVATISEESTRRFQPKPKLQVYRERYDGSIPGSDVEGLVSCQPDSHLAHLEMDFVDEGADHVFDFSNDGIITESTHEFPVHEECALDVLEEHPEDTSQMLPVHEECGLDAGVLVEHPEDTTQMPVEPIPQKPKTRKRKSQRSEVSEENGTGRSLRSRRKSLNANELVDEDVIDDGEYVPEQASDDGDEDFLVENKSQGKKVQKKTKRKGTKEGKRVQKSKKTTENKKPKKFSHSTRQKKRRIVDKVLLETPEDDIDYQRVPIRDLIILAEHRERLKKDTPVSEAPTIDQGADSYGLNMDQGADDYAFNYDEDETRASDEDREANDHQTNPTGAQDTSVYLNYQTYMDKTPRAKWSKQDTELFYEAVQQFGTDLSLIQQLFPGRTRRQLKLKYKKEERQHPFRLHDALTTRSKDHSHFESVIARLKQIEDEEFEGADKDESMDMAGGEEEVEMTQEINEEEGKSEHVEEQHADADVPEMESPAKDYDSEDDWLAKLSQYKSEV